MAGKFLQVIKVWDFGSEEGSQNQNHILEIFMARPLHTHS